jgi:hypothetical protein
MPEMIRVTDDWEIFKMAVSKKLETSTVAIGYYQPLETGKDTILLKASIGELGYEREESKKEAEEKIEYLRKLKFVKLVGVVPDDIFFSTKW